MKKLKDILSNTVDYIWDVLIIYVFLISTLLAVVVGYTFTNIGVIAFVASAGIALICQLFRKSDHKTE